MNRPQPSTHNHSTHCPRSTFAAFDGPAGKAWQLNLSLAPSRGFLTIGRDFGNRYFAMGLGLPF